MNSFIVSYCFQIIMIFQIVWIIGFWSIWSQKTLVFFNGLSKQAFKNWFEFWTTTIFCPNQNLFLHFLCRGQELNLTRPTNKDFSSFRILSKQRGFVGSFKVWRKRTEFELYVIKGLNLWSFDEIGKITFIFEYIHDKVLLTVVCHKPTRMFPLQRLPYLSQIVLWESKNEPWPRTMVCKTISED